MIIQDIHEPLEIKSSLEKVKGKRRERGKSLLDARRLGHRSYFVDSTFVHDDCNCKDNKC